MVGLTAVRTAQANELRGGGRGGGEQGENVRPRTGSIFNTSNLVSFVENFK